MNTQQIVAQNIELINDKVNQIKDKVLWQYNELMHTELMLTLATIVAVIVGVVSYAYRAARVWYNEGGREILINNACKFMAFVNKMAEQAYYRLEDADTAAA